MMEEDSWICIDETFSNDEKFSNSDEIDSETEAELYSLIHFEENLPSVNFQSTSAKNDTKPYTAVLLSDKMKYAFNTEKNKLNGASEFVGSFNNFLQNGTNECMEKENCDKTVSENSILKTFDGEIFHVEPGVPSNFVSYSNSDLLAESQSSNNLNKRKFDDSQPNCLSPPKKTVTYSERKNICVELNSSENKEIQTNICEDEDEDIIFISSDSENDHSSPSKMTVSAYQNMSMPNIKIGENSKDLWFVNQEDLRRARSAKSRRYHDKFDVSCTNCNGKGHHSRTCPLPKTLKCFICGGEHVGSACSNRMCGKCYKTGHERKFCGMNRVLYCALCHMQGHIKENCTDLWRRYHLTTQPGKIVPDKKIKQDSFVFCCTCGRPGHFGAVCNFEHGGYKNCFPTWPNVLSYDEPVNSTVQKSSTTGNKQKLKGKDLMPMQKNKNTCSVELMKLIKKSRKLARKERLKRKQLKRQELLKSEENHKVLKEKDFPRTPKNISAVNLFSPKAPKNNPAINLSSPKIPKNNSAINLPSPRTPKYNYSRNIFSPKTLEDDSVIILPSPKIKKNISFIDLTSPKTSPKMSIITPKTEKSTVIAPKTEKSTVIVPKTQKNNSVIAPKTQKNNSVIAPKRLKNNSIAVHNTLKNNSVFDESSVLPESVHLLMLAQARRREKNRKRKIRQRQKRLKDKEQSQNINT